MGTPLWVVIPVGILAVVILAALFRMRQVRAAPSLSNVSFPEGWTAPPELTGALPRKTRLSNDGIVTVMVATVFLLAVIAFVLWGSIQTAKQMAQMAALSREGLQTTGEVRRLWHSGPLMTTPWVSYVFTANGVAFTGKSSVPKHLWNGLREAGPLPIRFMHSNPAINHPAAWEGRANLDRWLLPCAFLVLPFTAFIGTKVMIPLRQDRQLVAGGMPAAGVILKCYGGGRGGWGATYQFRTEDGRLAEGSSSCGNRLEIGSTVCVLYSPQDPKRNHLYSALLYRVA